MKLNKINLVISFLVITIVCIPFSVLMAEASSLENTLPQEYTRYRENDNETASGNEKKAKNTGQVKLASTLPSQYDLRQYGAVTSVKNQGEGNICWSYAIISSLESNMIKRGLANNTINLSEKHLAWFTKYSYTTDDADSTYGDGISIKPWSGCDTTYAGYNLMRWSGASLESVFPIKNPSNLSTYGAIKEDYRYNSIAHVQDMIHYSREDMTGIKKALMEHGAMVISYHSDAKYYDTNTENGTSIYCDSEDYTINHAATIIGWDDNYSRDLFRSDKRPSSNGAWLIKNSWGEQVGENGYQWISYEDTSVSGFTQFLAESNNNYNNIYQYDGFGWGILKSSSAVQIKGANIFTASSAQELKAVAIHTATENVDYTVSIYTDLDKNSSDPEYGILSSTQSGSFSNSGYHTVKLNTPVVLEKGTLFSVVVAFSSQTYDGEKWISLEGATKTYQSDKMQEAYGTFYYHSKKGESFYNVLGKWEDASQAGYNNVCIKAYTSNISSSTQIIETPAIPGSTISNIKLAAPTKVSLTKLSTTSAKLAWNRVYGADGYLIYYSQKKNGSYRLVGRRFNEKQTTFTCTDLNKNKNYYFKICPYTVSKQTSSRTNGYFSKTISISMKKAISLPEIKLSSQKITLKRKQKKALSIVLPKSANKKLVKSITFKTNNAAIASVTKTGVITGKKKGKTSIKVTVTLKDNRKKTFLAFATIKP